MVLREVDKGNYTTAKGHNGNTTLWVLVLQWSMARMKKDMTSLSVVGCQAEEFYALEDFATLVCSHLTIEPCTTILS